MVRQTPPPRQRQQAPFRARTGLLRALPGSMLKCWFALRLLAKRQGETTHVVTTITEISMHVGILPERVERRLEALQSYRMIKINADNSYDLLTPARGWLYTPGDLKEDIPRHVKRKTLVDVGAEKGYYAIYARAARRLRIAYLPSGQFGKTIYVMLSKRLEEGHTEAELDLVIDWAVKRWASGDHFPPLRDLFYLWGKRFPTHLATAQVEQQRGGAAR